jgi:hypothetical protein
VKPRKRSAGPDGPGRQTVTLAEAMDRLGLSRFIVRGLIDDGELAMIRTRGAGPYGRILVTTKSLDSFIARNAEYLENQHTAAKR